MEGSGPSLPLRAVSQHRFTARTERAPSSSRFGVRGFRVRSSERRLHGAAGKDFQATVN